MPLEEPSWWYSAPASDWRQRALTPLANAYGWAVQRRFSKADPYRSELPVICVGNFTAGGTGKTPLALHLARLISQAGARPVFLSRGYGGTAAGPLLVDPAQHTANVVGDEPLLLAANAPTLISRDRAAGARALETLVPSPTAIIMDDGLQNPSLRKDLVIAVVDGSRGLGNGSMIPAGPLRAPLAFQLAMTDVILVNVAKAQDPDKPIGAGVLEQLRSRFNGPVLAAWTEPAIDPAHLAGRRIVAYAGIGNPVRFFRMLESLGVEIAAAVSFNDHHRFTEADAARLLALAAATKSQLVTTEKDNARLAGQTGGLAELREASETLPIRLALDPRDGKRLSALIETVTARRS